MENNTANTQTGKAKKAVLLSLGTLALGTLTFFGIKIYKKHKTKNEDDTDTQNTDQMDSKKAVQAPANYKPRPSLPAGDAGSTFPLRLRAKGNTVKQLQLALIRSYGAAVLPRFGADGDFGTELEAALKAKGYSIPLSQADYQKITQVKQPQSPAPLVAFDSAAIAKSLYVTITARDFNSSITLLKAIKDTSDYALVSEKLKEYYINGVRQNLVNAMLNTFTESSQHVKVQEALKNIGLKYNGSQWSLSGVGHSQKPKLKTAKECTIYSAGSRLKAGMIVPKGVVIGTKICHQGPYTHFWLFDGEKPFYVKSNHVHEITNK